MRRGLGSRTSVSIALAAIALTACSGGTATPEADPSPSEASPTPSSEPEPVEGGTLVVAISQDPGHLNPAITTSGGTHTASEIIYNSLIRVTPELELEGDLATDWEITDDGATYTFNLREGVLWHDGEAFTSEDVKFTFEEVLTKFHSRMSASLNGVLESIETPDDLTVVFKFNAPYAPFLQQLDITEAPIVAEHVYAGTDPETAEANLAPVGTGPFKFVSYTKDAEIRLEKNPDYFRPGLPKLDELVMRVIPEDSSQVIALEAGEVDYLWGAPGPDIARLRSSGDYEFLSTTRNPGGANCIMTVSFNLDRDVLKDVAVRKAFAHGIDREPALTNIEFGEGQVAEAPISSGIPFAHATGLDMPQHDPELAISLLEDAGWVEGDDGVRVAKGVTGVADGTRLSLTFKGFPNFAKYGELFREQLKEIGMELDVQGVERGAFIEQVFTDRDFDTNIISYCNQTDPEIGVRRMYISDNIKPIPFSNSSGYVNTEVDRLFNEARGEADLDTRSALYQELSEILVDELPYYWIVETVGTRVYRKGCTGFVPFGHFAEAVTCS